jgi:hypothetical protein
MWMAPPHTATHSGQETGKEKPGKQGPHLIHTTKMLQKPGIPAQMTIHADLPVLHAFGSQVTMMFGIALQ